MLDGHFVLSVAEIARLTSPWTVFVHMQVWAWPSGDRKRDCMVEVSKCSAGGCCAPGGDLAGDRHSEYAMKSKSLLALSAGALYYA